MLSDTKAGFLKKHYDDKKLPETIQSEQSFQSTSHLNGSRNIRASAALTLAEKSFRAGLSSIAIPTDLKNTINNSTELILSKSKK